MHPAKGEKKEQRENFIIKEGFRILELSKKALEF
jgi:hypothetical protein